MIEKWSALLLSGVLTLSLAACAAGGEGPNLVQAPPTVGTDMPSRPIETAPPSMALGLPPETDAPETPETPVAGPGDDFLEPSLPRREYQPWQVGYMDFLSALAQADKDAWGRTTETGEYYWPAYEGLAVDERGVYCLDAGEPLGMTTVMAMGSENYSLHDVDGDGVPELFVQYGNCEAAYTTQCYTFRDGQVVCIGEFDTGHSGLYTDPGRSAVVRSAGHMGYKEVYEYPMEGGRLTEERVLFTEEDVREYTETDEVVPGAEYIPWFYAPLCLRSIFDEEQDKPSAGKALLLPICDYYDGIAATGDPSGQAREAILAALNGETELYGASGDHFNGDVGWICWEDYAQAADGSRFNVQIAAQTAAHAWLDMNGDGQEECVLQMETEAMRDGEPAWTGEFTVVLSEQEGTVYAYCFHHYYDAVFCDDGTIRDDYGKLCRLSFWQDQCYEYAVRPDAAASPVKWVDGPPMG